MKVRIPKLAPSFTIATLAFGLMVNVYATWTWIGVPVVTAYAATWHTAFLITVLTTLRTVQAGDKFMALLHAAGVLTFAYLSKLLSGPMPEVWQVVLYNANIVCCIILSFNFISSLAFGKSSGIHDGAWDEDYAKKKSSKFWNKSKHNQRHQRREEPEDIPFEAFTGGYKSPPQ